MKKFAIAASLALVVASAMAGPIPNAKTSGWFGTAGTDLVMGGYNITGTGYISDNSADPADASFVRMGNNVGFAWEANPTGTDLTFKVGTDNVLAASGAMSVGGAFTASTSVTTGGVTCGAATITSGQSPYTLLATDCVVFCNATGGAITITTGSAASNFSGRVVHVKKTDGSINACTFDPNASETVDGSTTHVNATQYDSFSYTSDGTNWFII